MLTMSHPVNTGLWRRKRSRPPSELGEEWDTIEELKRLKLHDALPVSVRKEPSSSQALIPLPVAPSKETFKMAISVDFPETSLGRLFRQADANSQAEESSASGKELVVYQPTPLSELLKQAAYLDEHQMLLD
ncbi:hypothetical protein PSACC_00903 [Paramicrosporidium saccamoebae]|uniref:Uncharacterized protein n=1 Tax=Paramicrosporidium saccamoebae TaxID=1246581 RepID=A0A2H9TNF2_9FUNG|nr:hypothetical protein PSACC_00903 [Paramicrosporidium saccamoebae]